MPVPVAIGGKSSSCSCPVDDLPADAAAVFVGEEAEGFPLEDAIGGGGGIAVASNQTLLATLSVSYHHLLRRTQSTACTNGTIASLEIQISPLAASATESFSTHRYRQSVFQIPLDDDDASSLVALSEHSAPPQCWFGPKHLLCLVASRLIIFQLRKPHKKSNPVRPPLPSYIQQEQQLNNNNNRSSNNNNAAASSLGSDTTLLVPIATNPRVVPNLSGVTCACFMETHHNHHQHLVLVGTSAGTILLVSARDATTCGTLVHDPQRCWSYLNHFQMIGGQNSKGRLVAIDSSSNGTSAQVFESHALVAAHASASSMYEEDEEDDGFAIIPTPVTDDDQEELQQQQQHGEHHSDLLRVPSKTLHRRAIPMHFLSI